VTRFEAIAWLDAHVNLETGVGAPTGADRRKQAPTLERIRALLELLGSPQVEYPAIHVTGTNGKTSAVRMATALLGGAGLSVGSYTSPHLERVNERIAWDGDPIGDAMLAEVLTHVAAAEDHLAHRPSYFEVLTAAAFDLFADVAVEVAVVEVGLGGTWDATNVLDAGVAVVTNVSIDHVEYLGRTRDEIAADKAGIIRPGATLVLGEDEPEMLRHFADREPGLTLRRGRDFGVGANRLAHGGRLVDLYTPGARYGEVFLAVHGAHQAQNASVALCAAEAHLGVPLSPEVVADVFATVRSPGRLEVVGHRPLVLLDGAHNVAGAHALVAALDEEFAGGERTLVVGLLREKEPREMLEALAAFGASHIVCTSPPSPRALDPMAIADAAESLGVPVDRIDVVVDAEAALERAFDVTPADGQVIVTGSLYLVGAARAALHPESEAT